MKSNRAPSPAVVPIKRCAVYTRKSSEEGLEQAYNSLEAQHDAGLAFVASQRHEGWIASDDGYDDGGHSGGTLDRPGLRRLLTDIEAGRVDIVVVYKIDRLTRSLTDFAQLVDIFDRHGVSFVSVTQQFNTTTSMGRLTLNILLSFAQFEREVAGERIRDKIAASKAKGWWMGGVPPLGYDVADRHLVINPREADLVRDIFRRYAEHGSAARLSRELAIEGHTTKDWITQDGRHRRGRLIDQHALFKLLRNRVYLGEIAHKGVCYPGRHPAIVTEAAWDAAHAFIDRRSQGPRERHSERPALLAGLLFAADGQRMLPTSTRKRNGRLYRYYVPYRRKRGGEDPARAAARADSELLPAAEIEQAVLEQIHRTLQSPEMLVATWNACRQHPERGELDEPQTVVAMRRLGTVWEALFPQEQQRIARLLIERVQLHEGGLDIVWHPQGWQGVVDERTAQPLLDELRDARATVAA